MAKRDKYHHLVKRGATWHFRKSRVRFSLDTTDAADALRKRDRLLENFRLYGQFTIAEAQDESPKFGEVVKEWAEIHLRFGECHAQGRQQARRAARHLSVQL